MHQKNKTQYWILSLNPEFCTVDDLKLGRHGFVYDGVLNSIGVKEGDVAILFDSHARSFKTIGRFLSSIGVGEVIDDDTVRHDFLLKVAHKRNSATKLVDLKKELRLVKHPAFERGWPTQGFSKLTSREFDQLMEAWWGVKEFSQEFCDAAEQKNPSSYQKYLSYRFAFQRMKESIEAGFFLEASTIAESVISDRLLSACNRKGTVSANLPLSKLINIAISVNPAVPTPESLHEWRIARNQVIHAVSKSAPGKSTLKVSEFMELAESTAVNGLKLARIVATWSKKVQRLN